MKILMVLTSHDQLGDTGHKTGFWLEEFAAPYYVFKDAGAEITLASPAGGQPPLDPKSNEPDFQTDATRRFMEDRDARTALANTSRLADLSADGFDAGKPVAAVCHAPAVLKNTKMPDGKSLVAGKSLTGFSNTEEAAVQLTDVVPFLLEDELSARGASYQKADDWQPHAVIDGNLITGQNPASSELAAKAVLDFLK
jgi:putative intracellular protease/amidase